jgi:hypothetical protein
LSAADESQEKTMSRRMPPDAMRPLDSTIVVFAGFAAAFLMAGLRPIAAQPPADAKNARADDADEKPEIKARLKRMRERAAGIKLWRRAGDERKPLDAKQEPLFRLVDPTRDYPDGTLWAWPEKGRPAALVALSVMSSSQPPRWLYEFVSLSESEVGADFGPDFARWSALGPGWEPHAFRDAPAPADSDSGRLRQMRELARRFEAVEFLPTRFELRLLPQPVLRYADPRAGQLDGAVFLFCHGTNPEIILTVEAQQEPDKPAVWQYAFARNSIAGLRVTLGGAEVWARPLVEFSAARANGPYSIATQAVSANELQDMAGNDPK